MIEYTFAEVNKNLHISCNRGAAEGGRRSGRGVTGLGLTRKSQSDRHLSSFRLIMEITEYGEISACPFLVQKPSREIVLSSGC